MARMKDCYECNSNIAWEAVVDEDGPREKSTPREMRREHSTHSTRRSGNRPYVPGDPDPWGRLVFRRNGRYIGTVIHHGRK